VASPEGGQAIVDTAKAEFGHVDIVINNAGIARPDSMASLDPKDFEDVLRVHLLGAFYVSQPAYRDMMKRRFGRFVFTSSNVGVFGRPERPNYSSAKAGVLGLCSSIALEGAPNGILANAILPMAITRMAGDSSQLHKAIEAKVLSRGFMDRFEPTHVAHLVVVLCSDECPVNNGVFSAGGGYFARVFNGLTAGWTSPSVEAATAENLLDHWTEVESHDSFLIPTSFQDEIDSVTRRFDLDASYSEPNK
jgi:NAD(P)-dependent dehydrogenase (short-subunit alcohol dehydrogenase family)